MIKMLASIYWNYTRRNYWNSSYLYILQSGENSYVVAIHHALKSVNAKNSKTQFEKAKSHANQREYLHEPTKKLSVLQEQVLA